MQDEISITQTDKLEKIAHSFGASARANKGYEGSGPRYYPNSETRSDLAHYSEWATWDEIPKEVREKLVAAYRSGYDAEDANHIV